MDKWGRPNGVNAHFRGIVRRRFIVSQHPLYLLHSMVYTCKRLAAAPYIIYYNILSSIVKNTCRKSIEKTKVGRVRLRLYVTSVSSGIEPILSWIVRLKQFCKWFFELKQFLVLKPSMWVTPRNRVHPVAHRKRRQIGHL